MSQISKAIFATLAVSGTFGAVQIASGQPSLAAGNSPRPSRREGINRGAKADRAASNSAPNPTETVTLRSVNLADTSVLVRIPVQTAPRPYAVHARSATARTVGQAEAIDRLRTAGQRFDRGRQTSPARPLRDLNGAFRDP